MKKNSVRLVAAALIAAFLAFAGQSAFAASDIQPVTFLDNPDPVPARGIVEYTVVVQNNDPDDPAVNPRLEVTVPVGFSFFDVDDANCSYSGATPSLGGAGDKVICSGWGNLVLNRTVKLQYQASDAAGTFLVTATVFADADSNPANNSELNLTDVTESADLALALKESIPSTVPAGGIVTYQFQVDNAGPFAADNLVLNDTLPPGLTWVGDNASPPADQDGSWACTNSGQDVSCTATSLGAAASSTFYFRVKATTAVTGSIDNSASVTSDTSEPDPDNNTATDTLVIVEGTDMSIHKTVDTSPAIGGQPVQFSLTATNEGPMTAATVEVIDVLPTGYTDLSVITEPAGWTCVITGLQVSCTIPSMIAGRSDTIVIEATPPLVTDVVTHQNPAEVSSTTTDPIPGNNAVIVDYDVSPDTADLRISKSKTPDPVAQYEPISDTGYVTSTIVVENLGPRAADPVQVVDVLSANETYSSYTEGQGWTCNHNGVNPGGTVTCDYSPVPLAAGATANNLVIITQATNAGTLTNNACTGGQGGSEAPSSGDTLTGNNCTSATVIATSDRADLVVEKTTDDDTITSVPLENSFTYTITIHNNGPQTAQAVELNDIIPQYVGATANRPVTTIGPVTTSQGNCLAPSGALVHCDLGDIPVGNTVTITMPVARPMEDGTETNYASAFSTLTGDPDRSNNTGSQTVTVEPVTDISVAAKTVTYAGHPADILAGTVATYTIQVRNNGPSQATAVQLQDVFSGESFAFISATVSGGGSCVWSSPNLDCDLGNMNADTVKSITVKIRPDHINPMPVPWQIDNTATVSMDPAITDSDGTNNAKSLTLPVTDGSADLAVEKNESPLFREPVRFNDPVAPDYIVYEVVVSNRGPSLATAVEFIDTVTSVTPVQSPVQQLQFLFDTANADGTDDGTDICNNIGTTFTVDGSTPITCILPASLSSGESYTRYLVFEAKNEPDPISGDAYHNEVTVSGYEPDPNPLNNSENENTTVRTVVDLGIDKTGPVVSVEVEELFSYTITVTNYGPGISPGAEVFDTLPEGMELTGTPSFTALVGSTTGSCGGAIGGRPFTCVFGSMNVDDVVQITAPVKVTDYTKTTGGTITNTATVVGQAPEPTVDPHPNTDPHTVPVYQPAVIGDRVWLDRNADGLQNETMTGIDGVLVTLLDNVGDTVTTTTTAGGGYYRFTINHAANYEVMFALPVNYYRSPANVGANDVIDSDADQSSGKTGLIAVNYGDNNLTIDAGVYEQLTLGNRVWLDNNANGTQNTGELGIPGLTVTLYSAGPDGTFWTGDDISEATTMTDASGLYLFTALTPGNYAVELTTPVWAGYLSSPLQSLTPNNNNNTDSNISGSPSPGIFRSGMITLSSRDEPNNDGDTNRNTNLTLDLGLVTPASVGNVIWLDENSDGIQDAGEPGIANVTLQLKDSDGLVIATTITDTHGGYLFKGLAPDDYFIEVLATSLPSGLSQTIGYPHPGADFSNQDQSIGNGYAVHLTSGGENLTSDFGYNWNPTSDVTGGTNQGSLGDRLWIDSNGDGIQDSGEPGVEGAELTLFSAGPDGLFWTADDIAEDTTLTDAAGNYIFDSLDAGAYVVEVTDSSSASHDILNLAGYSQTGDPDHFSADLTTAPAGTAADNRSTRPVVLGPGDVFVNLDFGYLPENAAALYDIGDTIWFDLNRDGVVDTDENGIGGVTVGLQNGAAEFIATTTTAVDGTYLFTDLPDGEYTVVVTDAGNILAELLPTYDNDNGTLNPDEMSVVTLAGADNLDQDFGYVPSSANAGTAAIGDTIFLDRNGNNSADAGEGLEGIRVFLINNSGDVVAVAFTDENGNYLFAGLAAGTYTIQVDTLTLPAGVTNSVDPDGGLNSTSTLVIAGGEINLDQDFGYVAAVPGTIGDLVWLDTNADGIYQPNGLDGTAATEDDELPLSGITIDLYRDLNNNNLLDPNEPLIGTTTTDANGNYLFTGLPAGEYLVKVSDRASYLNGFWHSRGADNSNNNSQADYYAVTLGAGVNVLVADFGYYYQPGSLGDLVWKDDDLNGLYDGSADSALAGVRVYLDILYPDNTTVTLEGVTAADGRYMFYNLLLDENFNGIGTLYGNGGDEPSHTVRIDDTTIPAGISPIYPTRVRNTDSTTVGGAAADEEDLDMGSDDPAGEPGYPPMGSVDITNDFGYFDPGSIGDTIWNDQNNDGIIDAGEGLDNIRVYLTPPADVDLGNGLGVALATFTDSNGLYLFGDLPPGDYTVAVDETTLPVYLQGHNTVDPDGGINSTSALTLAIAEDNLAQDFAYFIPSGIGNFVWDDSNANGIQDNGEAGHQGITVHLLDGGGTPVEDPLHPGLPYILQTGPSGEYLFENLLPGTYQVHFILPVNTTFTSQDQGADDSLDSDANTLTGLVTVNLPANVTDLTIDAGLVGAAINIEKSTNGIDADTPPGVLLGVGDTVTWSYLVTNTGNVTLTSVSVSDSKIGTITCPQSVLAPAAFMTCSATGTAVAGQYINIGSVVGSPPSGPAVIDSDPSHYLAGSPFPAIDIEKSTNGYDADTGTGPVITVGDAVTWTYVVSNTGNVDLTDVNVTDDRISPVNCPQTTLTTGASMTCTATGVAAVGQYGNIGTASGTPPSGPDVTDSDPSHYYGFTPGSTFAQVDLQKATDGQDADAAPGPYAEVGETVIWTYVVTNTGDVDLTNVTVTDDQIAESDIHCPNDGNTDNSIILLAVGQSATCTATGVAAAGQYQNTGTVVGTPPTGPNVSDTDPSHYFGAVPSIDIEKATNGFDADTPPGPHIKVDFTVNWTYVVTNTGRFALTGVNVTDDMGVTVSCPQDTLAIGEFFTCTATGLAVEGYYENIGSVTGTSPKGVVVTDDDPSHYLGKSFFWELFMPAMTQGCPAVPDYCYMVADGDNKTSTNSPLFKYVFKDNSLELLNRLGVNDVEAIILSLDGKTLYAADKGVFGIIDPTPGAVKSFKPIAPGGVGAGRGRLGTLNMADIDGLSFDPTTGILFGSVRYGEGLAGLGELDLLIQIDHQTGKLIKNGFGRGIDYVVIDTAAIGANDVDDIAIDSDGTLYAVAGNSGGGGGDHLVVVNKKTGAVTDAGALSEQGGPVQDMEGLTLYNTRVLYGTTGMEFSAQGTDNSLYRIDKATGQSLSITRLNVNFNDYVPKDFEAIACFPICK